MVLHANSPQVLFGIEPLDGGGMCVHTCSCARHILFLRAGVTNVQEIGEEVE